MWITSCKSVHLAARRLRHSRTRRQHRILLRIRHLRHRLRHRHQPPKLRGRTTGLKTLTIPAGTDIGVTMIDSISSKTNRTGQTFRGSLSSPVVVVWQ